MADYSLTTLFVVPVGQTTVPSSGSTQDLAPGEVGFFLNDYSAATAGNIAAAPYFYIAQGRANTYLLGSKRSDKIKASNVTEWYKVNGCGTPLNQISEISGFKVKCGEDITITLRAHSALIDTLYFNGLTRSFTVTAPCCDCGADPCVEADVEGIVDLFMAKFAQEYPGINPDNSSINDYFTFEKVGTGVNTTIVVTGKALTKYGLPCDVAAYPHEFDRMWFRGFVYAGPATTADFLVSNACELVGDVTVLQRSTYTTGTATEIALMEKQFYSYQAGYLKHLYRLAGYNQNFETHVDSTKVYDTFYIKFNEYDRTAQNWNSNLATDSTVILAVEAGTGAALETILVAALGAVVDDNTCATTTTTTTVAPTTTTTTTGA